MRGRPFYGALVALLQTFALGHQAGQRHALLHPVRHQGGALFGGRWQPQQHRGMGQPGQGPQDGSGWGRMLQGNGAQGTGN